MNGNVKITNICILSGGLKLLVVVSSSQISVCFKEFGTENFQEVGFPIIWDYLMNEWENTERFKNMKHRKMCLNVLKSVFWCWFHFWCTDKTCFYRPTCVGTESKTAPKMVLLLLTITNLTVSCSIIPSVQYVRFIWIFTKFKAQPAWTQQLSPVLKQIPYSQPLSVRRYYPDDLECSII